MCFLLVQKEKQWYNVLNCYLIFVLAGGEMNGKIKMKGQLKIYMQFPILLGTLLIIMNIAVFTVSVKAGALVSVFVAAYILIVVFLYFHSRAGIMNVLISFATQYGQVQMLSLIQILLLYKCKC